MKVIVSSEVSGYSLKEEVVRYLKDKGYDVLEVGQMKNGPTVYYPEAASEVARMILGKQAEKAILICGTGAGVSIVANKFKGIYCVACESLFTAGKISFVNNANVLAMGRNVVGLGQAFAMADAFLESGFAKNASPERRDELQGYLNRVIKIEDENFR